MGFICLHCNCCDIFSLLLRFHYIILIIILSNILIVVVVMNLTPNYFIRIEDYFYFFYFVSS